MNEPGKDATVTIRITRAHLLALAMLLVGLAAGVAIGRASAPDSRPILYGIPPAGASTAQSGTTTPTPPTGPVEVATEGRPALGPPDAKVTVVEFVDYQCPFCGRYARDTYPLVRKAYGDKVRYVSRHFPLDIHANAMRSAIAAECAYKLGKFWAYHDMLFMHQEQLDDRGLIRMAREVGLDPAEFKACTRSKPARAAVDRDLADGRRYGVTGTPAFFINGAPLQGAQPFAAFKTAIEAALKKR